MTMIGDKSADLVIYKYGQKKKISLLLRAPEFLYRSAHNRWVTTEKWLDVLSRKV